MTGHDRNDGARDRLRPGEPGRRQPSQRLRAGERSFVCGLRSGARRSARARRGRRDNGRRGLTSAVHQSRGARAADRRREDGSRPHPTLLRRRSGDAVPARLRVAHSRPQSRGLHAHGPSTAHGPTARRAVPAAPHRAAHRSRRRRPHRLRLRTRTDLRLPGATATADDRRQPDHSRRARRAGLAPPRRLRRRRAHCVRLGLRRRRLVRVDNIATLQSARGRGYGLALTAAAAAAAIPLRRRSSPRARSQWPWAHRR